VERREREAGPYSSPWLFVSIGLPVLLGLGLLLAGFGIGTLCTDTPGNGGLAESPCNRVDLGVKLGIGLQAALWLIAVALVWRSGRVSWRTRLLVVLSGGVFVVALIVATSY
jgi:hypothetical protein